MLDMKAMDLDGDEILKTPYFEKQAITDVTATLAPAPAAKANA